MDKIIWKYVKPISNPKVIIDFLAQYNIKLPGKMIQCMIDNNGGRPTCYQFDTERTSGYVFQSLFSYNVEDRCTIYAVYPDMFENTSLFPIGLESAGNIVCYDQDKQQYVLWNHENDKCEKILMF